MFFIRGRGVSMVQWRDEEIVLLGRGAWEGKGREGKRDAGREDKDVR